MNKILKDPENFELLRKINSGPNLNQRELAEKLGFSLGKLNYCLKALKEKGFVKIKNFKKSKKKLNYSYLLTPRGISYKSKMAYYFMKQKIEEYEEIKKEIEDEKNLK